MFNFYLQFALILAQQPGNGTTVTAADTNYFILDSLIVAAGVGLVLFAICRTSNRR